MTIKQAMGQLVGRAKVRIQSEDYTERTGMAWAFEGKVAELDEVGNTILETYGYFIVRDIKYNEYKECFVFVID